MHPMKNHLIVSKPYTKEEADSFVKEDGILSLVERCDDLIIQAHIKENRDQLDLDYKVIAAVFDCASRDVIDNAPVEQIEALFRHISKVFQNRATCDKYISSGALEDHERQLLYTVMYTTTHPCVVKIVTNGFLEVLAELIGATATGCHMPCLHDIKMFYCIVFNIEMGLSRAIGWSRDETMRKLESTGLLKAY